MGGMKVSNMDFIKLLPAFMQDDEAAIALSKAVNKLIGEPGKRLATIRTWDKVDELTEAECNEMAWELDIDWYDSEGMSLTEKRNTIKLAQQIKRKRGTKWAVERLIGAYFGEGYVMEWFEMDDSPNTKSGMPEANRKVKGTLHWVSCNHCLKAEVRLYDRLWKVENPRDEMAAIREAKGCSPLEAMQEMINPDSLKVLNECYVEKFLADAKPLDYLQFQRIGYFNVDKDSTPDHLVFNRTVSLKDTWSKINK